MKLSAYYPETISAWAFVEGDIPETGTSGVTFARQSATVMRVTQSGHLLVDGMYITYDGLTGNEAYLNGTWPVTSTTGITFDFTISGAVIPTGTLVVKNGHPTKVKKSNNIAKVGRISVGRYKFYFTREADDADYIAIGNAVYYEEGAQMGLVMSGQNTTGFNMQQTYFNGGTYNVKYLHVAVIGGVN
jgi:hypothetical protein